MMNFIYNTVDVLTLLIQIGAMLLGLMLILIFILDKTLRRFADIKTFYIAYAEYLKKKKENDND